jgi:flagellar biosynthesis protein
VSQQPRKPAVAVALEYDFKGAPRVTAKGRGAVAENILKLAREHGVTVEENPVLAEALSQVELDDQIPEELYRAVAEVLTFVLRANGQLRRKAADGAA